MKKVRLDILLVEQNDCTTREEAQRWIRAGKVLVDEIRIDKPGTKIDPSASIRVQYPETDFASRGGLKLEKALDSFQLIPLNKVCADFGASTGGFTDCLLKRGAQKVFAIDVGQGQLLYRLQIHPQVVVMDKTNCRYINKDDLGEFVDWIVADLSFISLKTVFPAMQRICKDTGDMILLVKPQFEIGKGRVGKKGIVRKQEDHLEVLNDIHQFFSEHNWFLHHITFSPVQGKSGNIEYIVHLNKAQNNKYDVSQWISSIAEESHTYFTDQKINHD